MIIEMLAKPIAENAYKQARLVEKSVGYQINLTNSLNDHWINSYMLFDMTSVWKNFGIDAVGVNYFTMGHLKNNISSRFVVESPYYQSWFGTYLVRFNEERDWSINDHFRLAEADQKEWLKMYGDQNPIAKIDFESAMKVKTLKISGYNADLYKGDIRSHSDVGKGGRKLMFPFLTAAFAHHMNRSNPVLHLRAKHFSPKWHRDSPSTLPFQDVLLRGYIAIVTITKTTKAVIYANGAIFQQKNGNNVNTFQQIDEELMDLIPKIKIQPQQ